MDPQQQQMQMMHMVMAMMPIFLLVGILIYAFMVFVFWRIFVKAGMSGALGLLVIIPGIGWLICLCILAFGEWRVAPIPPPAYYPPSYPPPPVYPPAAPPAQP
jgi:hypothetical protein